MTATKNLGIWMDHSSAHLIPFAAGSAEPEIIESEFTHQEKQEILAKGEKHMHNKEQQQQSAYYKKLGEIIRDYDEVVLFGPTDAKAELFNILRADHLFENIKIEVKQADKMTDNQQQAFVREHFSKS